jgi:hypothetical protein
VNSDISLFPDRRAVASETWAARARSLTYRILAGAGRPTLLSYRPTPQVEYDALVHGFTVTGELAIAIPQRHAGRDVSRVRFAVVKEAPEIGVHVIAASVHLLGVVHWLSEAEKYRYIAGDMVDARLAEIAREGDLATIEFDVALLHDATGVTRVSSGELCEEFESHMIEDECAPLCATEDVFATPLGEFSAVETVMDSALMVAGVALDGLLFGEYSGCLVSRQQVANAEAMTLGTICLDVDRTGVTLMCIECGEANTVFLPFAAPVTTRSELTRAIAQLAA